MVKQNQTNRLLHIDMLRLLAIFLVIYNHTGERGYTLFAQCMESPLYFPYMASSVFCKIAVPLFFMISGALLLPKEESLKQLLSKRVLRMAVVLLLISVPYYVWLKRSNGLSVSAFLSYIYGESASTSLWYLYSYIALLLCLPFLRRMVKNMRQTDFLYLFAGHIVLTGVLPCLEYILWEGTQTVHASFTPVLFTSQNIFYVLMGYFLEHVYERKNPRKELGFGAALSVTAIFLTCLITFWKTMSLGGGIW